MSATTYLIATIALLGGNHDAESSASALRNSVEWVIQYRQVPAADAPEVRSELLRKAGSDKGVFDAILFTGEACTLLERAARYGDYVSFMERTDVAWEGLANLHNRYVPDGIAPAVRYEIGKRPDREWLTRDDRSLNESPAILSMERDYAEQRRLGLQPEAAWKRISENRFNERPGAGPEPIHLELARLGKWAITGYDAKDAERDVPAFLEAHYAFRHPNASETKSVEPAEIPAKFIGKKLEHLMRQDIAHMLRPADKVIEETEYRLAASRRPHAAPSARNIPASLSLFPNSDWVRPPGLNRPSDACDYCTDTLTLEGYAFRCFEGKEVAAANGAPKHQLTKCVATCPVAPGHERGGFHDFSGLIRSGGSAPLRPNADYELVAYPWYWAPDAKSAFFVEGDTSSNSSLELQNPPSQGRFDMPASDGRVIEVRLRVHTDRAGRFRLLLLQPDISAISFGVWYIKPATP